MTNTREIFFPSDDILTELKTAIENQIKFDVITIVGEGEPTLYKNMGEIISSIRKLTEKPIAVITNGALLYDKEVQSELMQADIVLPTMDAYDEISFKKINRPHKSLSYEKVQKGLEDFSQQYRGQLWIELMLIQDINDDDESLQNYQQKLCTVKYEKLYLNTPMRPPAEPYAKAIDHDRMTYAAELLGGISIDLLASEGFHSEIKDHYEAILSIIKRHPMNQHEIVGFLQTRNCLDIERILGRLKADPSVMAIDYKGYTTFRLR